MMRVPAFLVRQFYVGGSLRNVDGGFQLEARNPLGDGMLVGIQRFAVDGEPVDATHVSAARQGDATWTNAGQVSRTSPVVFRKGESVTFHVAGRTLAPGRHRLDVDLVERDAGLLSLTLDDDLAAG
jgi:hypothetical protein